MNQNLRKLAKFCLALVIIGFLMPVSCDMNGFELADAAGGETAMLLYGIFTAAVIGIIIGIILLMSKSIPIIIDWIVILAGALCGVIALAKNDLELQSGAYVMIIGYASSILAQALAIVKKE